MPLSRTIFVLAASALLWGTAQGHPSCDSDSASPPTLLASLQTEVVRDIAAKYHSLATNIELVPDDETLSLIPHASTETDGRKRVVVPRDFPPILCNLTLATYVEILSGERSNLMYAAEVSGGCFNRGDSTNECLKLYAKVLEEHSQRLFVQMSSRDYKTALALYRDALTQIVLHEYAHHLLNHRSRLESGQITRADAEFEADLFAVTTGTESGIPPTAMYYFFYGLEDLEQHTSRVLSPDYETAACRVRNVENIASAVGVLPGQFVEIGNGDYRPRVGKSTFEKWLKEAAAQEAAGLKPGSCGRITQRVIDEMFQERQRLLSGVTNYLDVLLSRPNELKPRRAARLVDELAQMTDQFHYLSGISAGLLAAVLMKSNFNIGVGTVMSLTNIAWNFRSSYELIPSATYGRILLMQAISILEASPRLSVEERMNRAIPLLQDAGEYNPQLVVVWSHLLFFWYKRVD
jgi:hypothetical protein